MTVNQILRRNYAKPRKPPVLCPNHVGKHPKAEVRVGARDYCRACSEFLLRPVVVSSVRADAGRR